MRVGITWVSQVNDFIGPQGTLDYSFLKQELRIELRGHSFCPSPKLNIFLTELR
jgi:hypothetical protein